MQISGNDVVIPVPVSVPTQKQLMFTYFKHLFPDGVCEEISDSESMYYTDISAKDSWDKHGRTDENANKMFHVICRDREMTIIHENTDLDIEEIRKNLKANFCF